MCVLSWSQTAPQIILMNTSSTNGLLLLPFLEDQDGALLVGIYTYICSVGSVGWLYYFGILKEMSEGININI